MTVHPHADTSELQNRIEDVLRRWLVAGAGELAANISADIALAYEQRSLLIYANGDHTIERRFLLIPIASPVSRGPGMGGVVSA